MVTSRTEEELVARAIELRPALIADQEETERRWGAADPAWYLSA